MERGKERFLEALLGGVLIKIKTKELYLAGCEVFGVLKESLNIRDILVTVPFSFLLL